MKIKKRHKIKKKRGLTFPILLASLGLLILIISFILSLSTEVKEEEIEACVINVQQDCSNLSLEDFTKCLVDYVKPYYNYTKRNLVEYYKKDGKYLIRKFNSTEEYVFRDILFNGGDCSEWAYVYRVLAESYNYTYTEVFVPNHVYNVVGDNTGYCDIDGLNYRCRSYGK